MLNVFKMVGYYLLIQIHSIGLLNSRFNIITIYQDLKMIRTTQSTLSLPNISKIPNLILQNITKSTFYSVINSTTWMHNSFHLNGHTLGFQPQTLKLEPCAPCTTAFTTNSTTETTIHRFDWIIKFDSGSEGERANEMELQTR